MKRAWIFLALIIISSVMLIQLALSAGRSSGGPGYGQTPQQNQTNQQVNCETYSSLYDRIRCRLENRPAQAITPEACRVFQRADWCIQLYKDAAPCYTKEPREKGLCFRQIAQITGQNLSEQAKINRTALRIYSVLLLYDLQERAERAYEQERINSMQAAEIIASIEEVKQSIFLEKSRDEIIGKMQALKETWRKIMQK
jgi:hypothetical protein